MRVFLAILITLSLCAAEDQLKLDHLRLGNPKIYTRGQINVAWNLLYTIADNINTKLIRKQAVEALNHNNGIVDVVKREHVLEFQKKQYVDFLKLYVHFYVHYRRISSQGYGTEQREQIEDQKELMQGHLKKFSDCSLVLESLVPSFSQEDATKIVAAYIFEELIAVRELRKPIIKPIKQDVANLIQAFENVPILSTIKPAKRVN